MEERDFVVFKMILRFVKILVVVVLQLLLLELQLGLLVL